MQYALIDLGNTTAKIWHPPDHTETVFYTEQWAREACTHLMQLSPSLIVLASVVPQRTVELEQQCQKCSLPLLILSPEVVATHSSIQWSKVSGMGIDRMLQLVGAVTLGGAPVIAVSAGTAITLTAADADIQCVGGAILPGIHLQLECLHHRTAQLPSVAAQIPPVPYGTDPTTAIQAGVLYGTTGALRYLIGALQRLIASPDAPASIYLTGGDAPLLQQLLPDISWKYSPNLLFIGIHSLLHRMGKLPATTSPPR